MAGTLTFRITEVLALIEHAKASPAQSPVFEDLMNKALLKAGVSMPACGYAKAEDIDLSKLKPSLLLVKDRGAYLMSAGTPRQLKPNSESSIVSYANGCDPASNEDWYERCHAVCGGDDFAERLETDGIENIIKATPNATQLKIKLTARRITITAK